MLASVGRIDGRNVALQAFATIRPKKFLLKSPITEMLGWSTAQRGALYRRVKQQITLRRGADIVAWFKRHARGGRGYQTDINRALRSHVQRFRR